MFLLYIEVGDDMRILIVEDEYSLAEIIGDRLKKEKYDYDILTDGEEGLYNALCGAYNLAILDVMLPNMNGFEILKQIRENKVDIKVIMLTAKTELDDKLSGFRYGADDYITKPFHIEELMARVNVQLRKDENKNITDVIEAFDLKLNLKKALLECTKTSESIEISNKEFMLLEYLMQNKNIIVSKEQIYDKVWGIDNEIESNNLEAYLSFIRKKINIIGSETKVKAVRGLGYKLEANDE